MSTKRCQICDKEFQLMSMDLHIATCHNSNQLQIGNSKKILKTQKMLKKRFSTMHKNKGNNFCHVIN